MELAKDFSKDLTKIYARNFAERLWEHEIKDQEFSLSQILEILDATKEYFQNVTTSSFTVD